MAISGSRCPMPRAAAAFLCAAALLMAACAKKPSQKATFGTGEEVVSYGVYSAQGQNNMGQAVKLHLNPNNTYFKRKFVGACMVHENKGEWTSQEEHIEFKMKEIRRRDNCDTEEWQIEPSEKTTERSIRNVTVRSFELLDQEETTEAEWIKFVKGP